MTILQTSTQQEHVLPASKKNEPRSLIRSPYVWSFTTYFTEGFPYTVIRQISSLFFRDRGVSLESIGLTSLFGLPWILKFLWAPFVDSFGTKRVWMLVMQSALAAVFVCAAFLSGGAFTMRAIALLFFAGSFVAATHDIAIDGYYMEALNSADQARFVGYRVMAYRIAMIAGTGLIATLGATVSWPVAFASAGGILAIFLCCHFLFLPALPPAAGASLSSPLRFQTMLRIAALAAVVAATIIFYQSSAYAGLTRTLPLLQKVSFSHWVAIALLIGLLALLLSRRALRRMLEKNAGSFYAKSFLAFIDRDTIGAILAVVVLLRTGELMLSTMVGPFFVDLGIKAHYGWISSAVGLPCSIAGALIGGWAIAAFSLKTVVWPFLLLQNLTNVVYMALALFLANYIAAAAGGAPAAASIGAFNLALVCLVHGFDQFAGGLGTAVLTTLLMRFCVPQFKAAHFAIGTGLMSVSGLFAGIGGGFLCSWLGYGYFFGVSFLLSLPGMVAVAFLPKTYFTRNASQNTADS